VVGDRLRLYYDGLDQLVDALRANGRPDLANELVFAKVSGATSGEALSNTGVELRKIARERLDSGLAERVTRLQGECSALWRGDA
jgi:hypothetical protein